MLTPQGPCFSNEAINLKCTVTDGALITWGLLLLLFLWLSQTQSW